jgi:hypothetical protein
MVFCVRQSCYAHTDSERKKTAGVSERTNECCMTSPRSSSSYTNSNCTEQLSRARRRGIRARSAFVFVLLASIRRPRRITTGYKEKSQPGRKAFSGQRRRKIRYRLSSCRTVRPNPARVTPDIGSCDYIACKDNVKDRGGNVGSSGNRKEQPGEREIQRARLKSSLQQKHKSNRYAPAAISWLLNVVAHVRNVDPTPSARHTRVRSSASNPVNVKALNNAIVPNSQANETVSSIIRKYETLGPSCSLNPSA